MSHRTVAFLLSLSLVLLSVGSAHAKPAAAQATAPEPAASPVMFIENAGQFAEGARFQVWGGPAGAMWLAEDVIWLTVVERQPEEDPDPQADPLGRFDPRLTNAERESTSRKAVNIKLSFVGANRHPRIEPFDRLDTVVSYFIGNEPDKWRPDVPVWGGVRYVDLYPCVDLELTSEGGQMVQRLAARRGADLDAVRLRVEGAEAVAVDANALRLTTAAGDAVLPLLQAERPDGVAAVQPLDAQTFEVASPYTQTHVVPASRDANSWQFTIPESAEHAAANPQSPADNPADLRYGTYLGGSFNDVGEGIAVDRAGSVYVTGGTVSSDFPTTPGAFNTNYAGTFVVKLNPGGSALAYATFLGGYSSYRERNRSYDIAVDGVGSAYVTGVTYSPDFPTTPGAFDRTFGGGICGPSASPFPCQDAFVTKLNPTGSALAYATFLGSSAGEAGFGIAVDEAGSAYVTGATYSPGFPTTPGAFDTSYNGSEYPDAFVAKLNPAGSGLAYATFLGGRGNDYGERIAVEGAGSAYVTGNTWSSDFPTTPGAFDRSYGGALDAFVVQLNPAGSGLAYATFLGSSRDDTAHDIAVDGAGNAYVTGTTVSPDFPTTPGAFDTSYNDGSDVFVVKLNPAGSALAYATFLGRSGGGDGIAVAGTNAYVTGSSSCGFPTTPGAFDTSCDGSGHGDAFVVRLNPAGSGLAYATFLGGSGNDVGQSIAVDGSGTAYVTGDTTSSNFPTTPGAFDRSHEDDWGDSQALDAFVVKLTLGSLSTYTVKGRVMDATGVGIGGVIVSGGAYTTTTTTDGRYTLSGLLEGSYQISPALSGYLFTPPARSINVPPDASGQDFIAIPSPRVTSVTPVDGAVEVKLDPMPRITASFATDMDTTTFRGSNVIFRECGGSVITTWIYRISARTIGVSPDLPLHDDTCYSVQLSQGIAAANGQPLPAPYTWTFVTEKGQVDLVPERIEVNQGVGDPDRLISGRNTVVRVFVKNLGNKTRVNARVRLEIISTSGVRSYDADMLVKQRYLPDDKALAEEAANFYFDACEARDVFPTGGSYQLAVSVDPDNEIQETNESNNLKGLRTSQFIEGPQLDLLVVRIRDHSQGTTPYMPALSFVPAFWPIRQCPPGAGISYTQTTVDYLGAPPSADHLDDIVRNRRAVSGKRYAIGYVDGVDTAYGGGWTWPRDRIAVIKTKAAMPYQTEGLVAHEMGHLVGGESIKDVYHDAGTPSFGCEVNSDASAFDIPYRRSGFWRLNTDSLGLIRWSIMCFSAPREHFLRGISGREVYGVKRDDYNQFLAALQAPQHVMLGASSSEVILVSGHANADGRGTLDPAFQIAQGYGSPEPGGSYVIELLNAGGQVLSSYHFEPDFLVRSEPPRQVDRVGFSFALPHQPGVQRVSLRRADVELAALAPGAGAPQVAVTSPNGGEVWSGARTVTWNGSDPDGDPLTYMVFYSPDGTDWQLVAEGLSGSSYAWDTSQAPGATVGRMRVLASDGLNTGSDESNSPFAVVTKPPIVSISTPTNGASFLQGQSVTLSGESYDLEDQFLDETALTWTSSLSGTLGTGSSLSVAVLPVGSHTITLFAVDKSGKSASAAVRVSVRADVDADGMADDWERANGLAVGTDDSWRDWDFDGLIHLDEFVYGTNPNVADTDGDGMSDGDEVRRGSNPLDPKDMAAFKVSLPVVLR